MKQIPTFLITNSVALNGGDAAILLSMIDAMREEFGADIKIKVQAKNWQACKKYYPEIDFIPSIEEKERGKNFLSKIFLRLKYPRIVLYSLLDRWVGISPKFFLTQLEREVIKSYKENNIVISCGGGFLNDYYPITARTIGFLIARIYKCKIIIAGQSLGPFWRIISKLQARWILENADLITVRDSESLRIAREELKINNANIFLTADFAHLLKPMDLKLNEGEENEVSLFRKKNHNRILVGISVRKWDFSDMATSGRKFYIDNYIKTIQELCLHLVENHNALIVFISTCQGRPEYFLDDSEFAKEITETLPSHIQENMRITSEPYNPRRMIQILKNFDVFIGVRMHTLILAMSAGIPCIGLEYEFKTRELMKRIDLDEYSLPIKDITPENLKSKVDILIAYRAKIVDKIRRKTEMLKSKAAKNIYYIRNHIPLNRV